MNTAETPASEFTPTKYEGSPSQVTCKYCGNKEQLGRWNTDTQAELQAHQCCFTCNHWRRLEANSQDPMIVRANGWHYTIAIPQKGEGPFRGFGGKRFSILFHDGRKVETSNLWCQGEIPILWQSRLPDNATFLEVQE